MGRMGRAALTLADVSGSVDALRVTCAKCDRVLQSHVERLIYDLGPHAMVSAWTARITADCPRRQKANSADPCAARLVNVPTNQWTEVGTGLVAAVPANDDR